MILQKLSTKSRKGFTLVEIMIVVAIIALLAAIAVPNFLRARKRSQATRILEDCRQIDAAISQYAIENNKKGDDTITWAQVQTELKPGSATTLTDIFGNSYSPTGSDFTADVGAKVHDDTVAALSDVVDPATYWSSFKGSAAAGASPTP